MNIFTRSVVAAALLSVVVSAQPLPAFEVASIRPSPEQRNDVTIGVRITGAQVRISAWPLKEYLSMAFKIRPQQIAGPDWLSQQYDIAATIPAGISQERIPDMLQALLADRFQMKVHREKRDMPVYAIGVARDGLKITALPPDAAATAPSATNVQATGSGNGVALDLGDGGSFVLANNRVEARKVTMEGLAGVITRFLDRPAIDSTGLTGRYDLTLDLTPEDYTAMMLRAASGAGVVLPPQAFRALDAASGNPLEAPMKKVGLTFEQRNAPLDFIVVDSMARTPTEN
jgi:uncharacterized protein (TIGR03435 family)